MNNELDVIGAASIGSVIGDTHHPVKPGLPCANCGEIVEQRYCTGCGQLASDFHRPVFGLIKAGLADMFALDGRLGRTLPTLLFRPGRVTRNYLDGQRARYVPPFRLFLLSSIMFFLALFTMGEQLGWYSDWNFNLGETEAFLDMEEGGQAARLDEVTLSELLAIEGDDNASPEAKAEASGKLERHRLAVLMEALVNESGKVDRDALQAELPRIVPENVSDAELEQTLADINSMADVYENQDAVLERVKTWLPRFSVLFLPIFSLLVALLYAWHRRLYLYDHIVTGLHFQTFIYLMGTALIVFGAVVPASAPLLWTVAFSFPIFYLYRMLRVTYETGHVLAFLRAVFLYLASLFTLTALVILVVIFAVFALN